MYQPDTIRIVTFPSNGNASLMVNSRLLVLQFGLQTLEILLSLQVDQLE